MVKVVVGFLFWLPLQTAICQKHMLVFNGFNYEFNSYFITSTKGWVEISIFVIYLMFINGKSLRLCIRVDKYYSTKRNKQTNQVHFILDRVAIGGSNPIPCTNGWFRIDIKIEFNLPNIESHAPNDHLFSDFLFLFWTC